MEVTGTATEGGALADASSSKDGCRDGSDEGAGGIANAGALAAIIGGRSSERIAALIWELMSREMACSSGARACTPTEGDSPSRAPACEGGSSGKKPTTISGREEAAEEATEGSWVTISAEAPSLRERSRGEGPWNPEQLEAVSP